MKLQEENASAKKAYEVLLEEHNKLKRQHAEDNGEKSQDRLHLCSGSGVSLHPADSLNMFCFGTLLQKRPNRLLMQRSRRAMILWQK